MSPCFKIIASQTVSDDLLAYIVLRYYTASLIILFDLTFMLHQLKFNRTAD